LRWRFRSGKATQTGRAEGFSDGVLAVAITLLALDLSTIHATPGLADGTLFAAIGEFWPRLLAFAASFAFIAVTWLNHHIRFERVKSMSRGLHAANLLLLAGVVLVPWVTSILADALALPGGHGQQEVAVYAAVLALLAGSWFWLLNVLAGHPELLEDAADARTFARDRFSALTGIVVALVGVAIGYLWSPIAATVLFLAVPIFYAVASEGFERVDERLDTS